MSHSGALEHRLIHGIGPQPCDVLVIGQRPGPDEYEYGEPFVGRAGEELWQRVWQYIGLRKRDVRVSNLVPTFHPDLKPPTDDEMKRWAHWRYDELHDTDPRYIIAVGYDAARYFLPQFAHLDGGYFHGLAFPFELGEVRATVVPIVHSSAALRQPDRYQQQLIDDCRAVRRVLDGTQGHHVTRPYRPYRVGLASFGRDGMIVSCDTEGSIAHPEAVTLSHNGKEAFLADVFDQPPSRFLFGALYSARRVVTHSLTADWPVLCTLGLDPNRITFDDTMIMAYLLGLPQGLKMLAYREYGLQMRDYTDLVQPIDDARVRASLRQWVEQANDCDRQQIAAHQARSKLESQRLRACRTFSPATARRERARIKLARRLRTRKLQILQLPTGPVPRRARTSVVGILDKPADSTLRVRAQDSTFAAYFPLPPEPTWKDAPIEEREPYALADAGATHYARADLYTRLRDEGLLLTYEIDRRALPFLCRNEQVGLACDGEQLKVLAASFQERFTELCGELKQICGWDVNPNAPPDVADLLFEELGLPRTRLTKGGKHHTTADKYLKALKDEHEAVQLVLDARKFNKLRGTYADKVPGLLRDGRYHPDWRYTRTATGRLAEPIIVLIPKHTKEGLQIRVCFHATTGHQLVLVDLSQIEMRVMAHLSRDKVLLDAYKKGIDIHALTAYNVLGAPKRREDQDESRHRLPAKTYNFAVINGTTEYGLLDQLNENHCLQPSGEPWDIESVKYALDTWWDVHKGVDQYWDDQVDYGRQYGYVRMLFGRKRYVPGLTSSTTFGDKIVKEAERQCLAPIQGTADDISKIWNAKIYHHVIRPRQKRGEYCEPWVRVHDETAVECDTKYAKAVAAEMIACLPQPLRVPVTAEAVIEPRWGAHKLEKILEKEREAA